jgi:hypothetical protein
MEEKDLKVLKSLLLKVMILTVDNPKELSIFEISMFTYIYTILKLKSIETPYLGMVDIIRHEIITLQSFSEQDIDRMTGFSSDDINRVMTVTHIPVFFTLGIGELMLYLIFMLPCDDAFHRSTRILRPQRTRFSLFLDTVPFPQCKTSR